MNDRQHHRLAFWGVLLLALTLRAGTLTLLPDNLLDDRDSYLRIARHLSAGNGYTTTGDAPTAFRPPLYPLILSPGAWFAEGESSFLLASWVGGINLICSLLTVAMVIRLARQHFNERVAWIAGLLTALNPFLVYQSTLPMTETLFALLCVGLVGSLVDFRQSGKRRLVSGIWLGLAALCRPTIWAFVGLSVVVLGIRLWRTGGLRGAIRPALEVLFVSTLVLAPWVVRNAFALNAFVPMTTHGGYTLLLGNNRVFYDEVVSVSWRTTWSGESLQAWQSSLDRQMAESQPPITGEVARNRWMSGQAWETIRTLPGSFLQSSYVRLLRFWNPVPLRTGQHLLSSFQCLILGGYACLLFLAAAGGFGIERSRRPIVAAIALLVVSTTLLHLVYWSNVRMRIPLEPLLAIVAALGLDEWILSRFRNAASSDVQSSQ